MDYKAQLKLQALLDGELPEGEASAVAQWVAQDREAEALLEELRNTRGALAGFHSIRVNSQWRLVFRWDGGRGEAEDVHLDDHSYR